MLLLREGGAAGGANDNGVGTYMIKPLCFYFTFKCPSLQRVVPIQSASTTRQAAPAHNYMVLEDHLHLVDSDPDLTTRARRNSRAPARPVTAATMIRRAKTAMASESYAIFS